MNRQQAKNMLPIIQALAEGKHIQLKDIIGNWKDIDFINLELCNPNVYRIKPQPKYRPFKNAEECWQEMQKHQPFGWVKGDCGYENISIIRTKSERPILINIEICGEPYENSYNMSKMLKNYTFADGTPFGIKEE